MIFVRSLRVERQGENGFFYQPIPPPPRFRRIIRDHYSIGRIYTGVYIPINLLQNKKKKDMKCVVLCSYEPVKSVGYA